MRYRIAALICFVFTMVISQAAQTRSVTNADLEKYRQARLTAEREYRDNYEKLGMPSPEELERRREQSLIETEKLSAKLRDEQLERDRLDALREQASGSHYPQVVVESYQNNPGYLWSWGLGYGNYRGNRGGLGNRRPVRPWPHQQPGYYAGGQFWPTGNLTPSRPAWGRPNNR